MKKVSKKKPLYQKKYKVGMTVKDIIILLKKENVRLIPYISNGLCNGCYFWADKTGRMSYEEFNKNHKATLHCPTRTTIPSCIKYIVEGKEVNVIFKKEEISQKKDKKPNQFLRSFEAAIKNT